MVRPPVPRSWPRNAAGVLGRLRNRPDSEHQQAIIRIAIVGLLTLYFGLLDGGTPAEQAAMATGFAIAAGYLALSVGCVLLIIADPRPSPVRRLTAMVTDFTVVSLLLHFGGAMGAPLYPIYLWIAFGNGFRYGLPYLAASVAVAFAGFLAVIWTTPFWHDDLPLGIGLLTALIVLPGYAGSLIRKLTLAKAQAEQANQAKSRFLAIVSHELRTPLNAVIGLSSLLEASRLDRDQREMVHTVKVSGQALLSLIDNVLDFSRIEAGKITITIKDFDLHVEIADLVSILRLEAKRKGLRLTVCFAADVPYSVRGDWPHLRQILTNLMANAVKFTEQGHVALSIARVAAIEPNGVRVRFEVADTGIGISPDHFNRIFESFTQADEAVNRRFGGSGLGLAIARQIAGLLGGEITVVSEPGKGSTFRLEMPLHQQAESPPVPAADAVLVVSPDRELIGSLRYQLSRLNIPAATAVSVEEALRALAVTVAEDEPHAVILIDGRDRDANAAAGLADELQDRWPAGRFGFVLVAAGDAPPPIAGPFAAVLRTPVEPETLAAAVHAAQALVKAPPPGGAAEAAGRADSATRPLDILVAEDNLINRKVTQRILATAGHWVDLVANGDDALAALEDRPYDLLILDINMPGMSGLDVAKLYRMAHLGEARLPIVALSADATPEARRACEEAGIDAHLTKPIEPHRLLDQIATLASNAAGAAVQPEPAMSVTDIASHPRFGESRSAIDWTVVQELQKLDGGTEFVAELLTDFVRDTQKLLVQIREDAAVGNATGFREKCHALSSSSANVGGMSISVLARQLSRISPDELDHLGSDRLDRLEHEFSRFRAQASRFDSRPASR